MNRPTQRFFNMKAGHLPNNQPIGIGIGRMNSEVPPPIENKVYHEFHNEFMNRLKKPRVISGNPLAQYIDPTNFHSVGFKKLHHQYAGEHIKHESHGHKKEVEANIQPIHNKVSGNKGIGHQTITNERIVDTKPMKPGHKEHHKQPKKQDKVICAKPIKL